MISTSCAKEKFTAFLSSAESMNMLTKEEIRDVSHFEANQRKFEDMRHMKDCKHETI